MQNEIFDIGDSLQTTTPRQKSGGCLRGCMIGCGGLFLLIVILLIGTFFAFKEGHVGFSQTPEGANEILQKAVKCKLPEGYQAKLGIRFFSIFNMVIIAPADVDVDHPNPNATFFFIIASSEMDEANLRKLIEQQRQQQGMGGNVQWKEQSEVGLVLGGKLVEGTKYSGEENGRKVVGYDVLIKPGVYFFAQGPEEGFDEKAMNAFLGSVELGNDR